MTQSPGTVLAFDIGEKRTGVAIGQTVSGDARALTILPTRDGAQDFDAIEKLIEDYAVDTLVVGLPLNMDDSEQLTTRMANKFARRLLGRFHLPVHLVDERLSSWEAEQALRQTGDDKNTGIDAHAACIILNDWMQQNGFKA
jgi:putative Holliday junction resolvase